MRSPSAARSPVAAGSTRTCAISRPAPRIRPATRRRPLVVAGVVLGTALLVTGGVLAGVGLASAPGPATVVRDYFAALSDADAPAALSYGELPRGPRTFLTTAVLREQASIAPLTDVTVTSTRVNGDRATVGVSYTLGFAGDPITTATTVELHRGSGTWRLDQVAVSVELVPNTAQQRLAMLGRSLPGAAVLLFPGAVPVRPDTPYLELAPTLDHVSFGGPSTLYLAVRISAAGESAVDTAVTAMLRRCVSGHGAATCPLPNERYVPGSLHGRLTGTLTGFADLDQHNPAGLLRYAGTVNFTGRWRALDYDNVAQPGSGRVKLDVRVIGYATTPLRLRWIV